MKLSRKDYEVKNFLISFLDINERYPKIKEIPVSKYTIDYNKKKHGLRGLEEYYKFLLRYDPRVLPSRTIFTLKKTKEIFKNISEKIGHTPNYGEAIKYTKELYNYKLNICELEKRFLGEGNYYDLLELLGMNLNPDNRKEIINKNDIKREIGKFIKERGHSPKHVDFLEFCRINSNGINIDSVRYRLFPEVKSFEELVKSLGFGEVKTFQFNMSYKLRRLGIENFESEIPLKIFGVTYRVDYLIQWRGFSFFLEIDGSSHMSEKSVYHKLNANRMGITRKESFLNKKEKDNIKEKYVKQKLQVDTVRIEYHRFMICDTEEFLECVEKQLYFKNKYVVEKATKEKVKDCVLKGMSLIEIAELYKVSYHRIYHLNRLECHA